MQTPMQSFGDSKTHPNTPCSASIECGGNRSTCGIGNGACESRRRLRLAVAAPGAEPALENCASVESITARDCGESFFGNQFSSSMTYWAVDSNLFTELFTSHSLRSHPNGCPMTMKLPFV